MKKTALVIGLLLSSNALAETARVLDVDAVSRTQTTYERVETTEFVCNDDRQHNGLIERGTAGVFGGTGGLIGTAVGVAVGAEIGKGRGNDAAKVVGGIIGNRIGNSIANRGQSQNCQPVTRYVNQPYTVNVISHYNVKVDINGSQYTVRRDFEPTIGSYIPVQLSVR